MTWSPAVRLAFVWATFIWLSIDCSLAQFADDFSFSNSTMLNMTDSTPHQSRTDCECGVSSKFATRIVGGERSSILQFPWMAGLSAFGFIFCGGALINDRYIISASHCFKDDSLRAHTEAFLGITYRDEEHIRYKVERVIQHEMYNRTVKGRYDIALIKLLEPVEFTDKVRPVCLPLYTSNFTDLYGSVTGWGVLEHGGLVSNELRSVPMKIMSFERCHQLYGRVDHNNLCAGGEEGKDACQGDSGSPLFVEVDGVHRLVGVVSWGIGCAKEGYPGVFTNMQHYLPWIIEHTQDAECQQPDMNPFWTEPSANMTLITTIENVDLIGNLTKVAVMPVHNSTLSDGNGNATSIDSSTVNLHPLKEDLIALNNNPFGANLFGNSTHILINATSIDMKFPLGSASPNANETETVLMKPFLLQVNEAVNPPGELMKPNDPSPIEGHFEIKLQ